MRIVCFHLNQVGDLVFSLPALKCIGRRYPDAHVVSVVRPYLAELLADSALVSEVLPRRNGFGFHKLALIKHLREQRFDFAVVFSQSAASVVLAYLSGAKRRLGFVGSALSALLTEQVSFEHPPSTQNNLRLVEAAGCAPTVRSYAGLLSPTEEQRRQADLLLASHGIGRDEVLGVLLPGTSRLREVKQWTHEGFAAVGGRLSELGIRAVLLGSGAASQVDLPVGVVSLVGQTTLGQSLAILDRARIAVGVDSGLLHLAAAVRTPVVGLYGPSNPDVTGPQGPGHRIVRTGVSCSPCMKTSCSIGRVCMTQLSGTDVTAAVDSVLSAAG